MAEVQKTKIIVLEPFTKAVEELLKSVQAKGQAEVEGVSSSAEVVQLTQMYQPCMMIITLTDNSQVPDRINLLKKLEKELKKGLIKTMFVTTIKNAQLGNLVSSMGVSDFIQEPVPVRTMQFKANLQIKAVDTVRKQMEAKKVMDEKIVFKKTEATKASDAAGAAGIPTRPQPALQLQQDSFLFKSSSVKKSGKKFVIEMEGPDPDTGDWKQHEDKGNAQTAWRWVPKIDDKGAPLSETGEGWVHEGDKPAFNDQSGKWQMPSEKPELSYRKEGRKLGRKVSTDSAGEVHVAADSPAAEENVAKSRRLAVRQREAAIEARLLKAIPEKKTREKAEAVVAPKAPAEDEGESPAQKLLSKMRRDKLGKAKNSLNAAESDLEQEEALEDPKGEASEEETGAAAPFARKGRAKKKPGVSQLDFLKNKMEAQSTADAESAEEEASEEVAEADGEIEAPEPENEAGAEPSARAGRTKKKEKTAAEKSMDALARMRSKLGGAASAAEESESAEEITEEELEEPLSDGSDESAASGTLRKKSRGAKKSTSKGDDSEASGENDDSEPFETSNSRVAKKDRVKTKRDLMAEIQDRLNEPLPDELPFEEEAALRKKFGLEGRPDVKPKDLARKDRLDAVKRLKEQLADAPDEAPLLEEEELSETNLHDLRSEESNTGSRGGGFSEEKRAGLLRAFDSEDAPFPEMEGDERIKKNQRDGKNSGVDLFEDKASYLPVASLDPVGGAWEKSPTHFVYLAGEVRYHGFESLEALVPIWIFKGDQVPELLDKTQQWRFFGPLPFRAQTVNEIPPTIRDYLLDLRAQLAKKIEENDGKPLPRLEATEEAAARKAKANYEADEEAAARKDYEEGPETQADGLDAKFKDKAGRDLEANLERMKSLVDGNATIGEDALSEELEAVVEASGGGFGSESTKSEKRDGAGDALSDRLAALKGRLGGEGDAEEIPAPVIEEAPAALAETSATIEKMRATASPAMEKFLEKRRKKKEGGASADPVRHHASPAATVGSPSSAYLGLYVSLSNSLGSSNQAKAVGRVLGAISQSFGHCSAALLAPSADEESLYQVMHASNGASIAAGDRVRLADGLSHAVASGESTEILGYLWIVAEAGRTEFLAEEETTAGKAAGLLWPVLKQARDETTKGSKAA